jgi:outer membrane protein OmpA-like peptidoglycan-associated protein
MKTLCFIFHVLLIFLSIVLQGYSQDNNYLNSKYDFIPGEKVVFYDDFSSESIGDFPAQWLTNGSGEVVTSGQFEGKWFQITKTGYFIPEAKEDFTDNFTVEFDIIPISTDASNPIHGINFMFLCDDLNNPGYGGQPGKAGLSFNPDYEETFWKNYSEAREWQGDEGAAAFKFKANEKYRVSFWVQKLRVRMYVNENKVFDLPRGLQANYKYNVFRMESFSEEATPLISNFRIATGMPDMRNKLLTDGKYTSYGILFDVNSDKIKPESYASVREIASILKENPTLRIHIIGHTDSDGDDASNLALSKKRSESVKQMLVGSFGIDASRMETDGKGETVPVAPNDSGVNKAKNRRVEFVKL